MAQILNGKVVAQQIQNKIKSTIEELNGTPRLTVILCTDDPASNVYVQRKIKICEEVGIESRLIEPHKDRRWSYLGSDVLFEHVAYESQRWQTDGILLQLPLPADMMAMKDMIIDKINPLKDVDCFTSSNYGNLLRGSPTFLPCTPHGICHLLKYYNIALNGKKVVIINRSNIVGKPLMAMMLQNSDYGNATVCVCHDHTPPDTLRETCLWADIIVVAVGKPKFLTKDMVRKESIVIDVGINRVDGKVCGDVDFENVSEIVSAITPVPGGVGPCTVAMLMGNTLQSFKRKRGVDAHYWDNW